MRVLILADDCNPEWPSVPAWGYQAVRAIAKCAEVVVATQVRNRVNIEKVGFGNAQVHYIDSEYIARPMFRLAKFLRGGTATAWTTAVAMSYPSYLAFEWEVWKKFKQEICAGKFDVVHRLTPISPTLPSPIAKWSPAPFVIGPINGGLKWPGAFRNELRQEREWLTYVRNAYRAMPYYRSTYSKARAVLAAFRHTIDDLPASVHGKVIDFPEAGFDAETFGHLPERTARKRKTILFVGRLVPYKLPQVVVRAFANSAVLREHRLVIVGDGPERGAIERLVDQYGLRDRIEMAGWRTQPEVAGFMREADIFAFPSIRELGAGVLVEAMACGLPCVVVDYGGPGTLIGRDRGIKIPLESGERLTQNLGKALELLVADEQTTILMGRAAHEHAMRYYSWDAKARKTIEVYDWMLGKSARPSFW